MSRGRRHLIALAIAAAAFTLTATPEAAAKDLDGRFGIGGELTTRLADSGLSAKFWFSEIGGQVLAGMSWDSPDAGETVFDVNLGLRVLWSAARTEATNFFLAGGVMLHIGDRQSQIVDVLIGVEHFLTDYFAVSGQLGVNLDIEQGLSLSLARGSWAGGFHFYF